MSNHPSRAHARDGVGVLVRGLAAFGVIAAGARILSHISSRRLPSSSTETTSAEARVPRSSRSPSPTPAAKVIGSFDDQNAALKAVRTLTDGWPAKFEVYSPNLNEELSHAMRLPKSPVRFWIAAGGVFGQLGGWVTTIMLSIYWRHPVAGMPVIAIPPFTIIAFEMMVLFGAGAGVIGLFFHCGLPALGSPPEYLDRFKQDRIGIVLECKERGHVARAANLLRACDADEIIYV